MLLPSWIHRLRVVGGKQVVVVAAAGTDGDGREGMMVVVEDDVVAVHSTAAAVVVVGVEVVVGTGCVARRVVQKLELVAVVVVGDIVDIAVDDTVVVAVVVVGMVDVPLRNSFAQKVVVQGDGMPVDDGVVVAVAVAVGMMVLVGTCIAGQPAMAVVFAVV